MLTYTMPGCRFQRVVYPTHYTLSTELFWLDPRLLDVLTGGEPTIKLVLS